MLPDITGKSSRPCLCNLHYSRLDDFNYLFSFNSIGAGEASDILNTRTKGSKPIMPENSKFIEPSSNSVTLHLPTWKDGSCRMSHFVVEYKKKYVLRNWFANIFFGHSIYPINCLLSVIAEITSNGIKSRTMWNRAETSLYSIWNQLLGTMFVLQPIIVPDLLLPNMSLPHWPLPEVLLFVKNVRCLCQRRKQNEPNSMAYMENVWPMGFTAR